MMNDSQLVVRIDAEEIFYDDEYRRKHCTRSIKNGKLLANENQARLP